MEVELFRAGEEERLRSRLEVWGLSGGSRAGGGGAEVVAFAIESGATCRTGVVILSIEA